MVARSPANGPKRRQLCSAGQRARQHGTGDHRRRDSRAGGAAAPGGRRVLPLRAQPRIRRLPGHLLGEALLFGSPSLLEYTAVAWSICAAAVRFYEEPALARRFGAGYQDRAVLHGFPAASMDAR
jgi:hypothetical protein